jgi:hypothetical protein
MKDPTVKIDQFLNKELSSELKSLMITTTERGNYELFGKYRIVPTSQGYCKVVLLSPYDHTEEFTSIKNAVTWCIFDSHKKYREANRIKDLDLRLCSKDVDIAVQKRMIKKAKDMDSKWVHIIKLEEDSIKKRAMLEELNSHINISKFLQLQKFKTRKELGFSNLR